MSDYMKRVNEEIRVADLLVTAEIVAGLSPTDAINKHAHTTEAYEAMVKKHGLRRVIPS